ncbi:MAG: NTP transferase domain-containing protein [Capsulimonas sp.]|uniref:NTP transferase domain-containing protein n=1 Tax=Capsulimonas sp. TaxID=2494211 RepID=UPI0032665905
MDAVIPAGGTIDAAYEAAIGSPHRALAPIGTSKTPVVQVVVDALRASGAVRQIIAVADPALQRTIQGVDRWVDATDSGPKNIIAGLSLVQTPRALVCTSDLPLIQSASIAAFAARIPEDADIALGLVDANEFNAAYPDAPPSTFVSLRGMAPITVAGLFAVRPNILIDNSDLLQTAFESRKSQWRSAQLLGPQLTWQFLARRLSLTAVVQRAETILKCHAAVLEKCAPDLAFDIDAVEDYQYATTRK